MFEKHSTNQKTPKAGRTAKGVVIACVEANATGADYPTMSRHRKGHVIPANGPAGQWHGRYVLLYPVTILGPGI